jgi:hypothetical protein
MPRTGRPLVAGSQRAERLQIRLTKKELGWIRRLAKRHKLLPSGWVRMVITKAIIGDQIDRAAEKWKGDENAENTAG